MPSSTDMTFCGLRIYYESMRSISRGLCTQILAQRSRVCISSLCRRAQPDLEVQMHELIVQGRHESQLDQHHIAAGKRSNLIYGPSLFHLRGIIMRHVSPLIFLLIAGIRVDVRY